MSRVILFLDDNPSRHSDMDAQYPDDLVVHAYDIHAFREALEAHERFDVVSLDYDLNDYTELGIQSLEGDGSEATGLDACGYLVRYRTKISSEVMIHSSNGKGARSMLAFLEERGIPVRWKMFGCELEGDDWDVI